MKALLYSDWEKLELVDMPKPDPRAGEVLLRVEAAGICGSELEAVRKHSPRRKPPLILGHEFTGTIVGLGEGVHDWHEGDAVVANAVIADGTCSCCRRGDTHLCLNRQLFGMHRPGAFAEFVTAPQSVLIRRPAQVKPEDAALTEPLANGVHIAGLLKDQAPRNVLVFGAGPIGLLTLQALKILIGCRVAVVDRSKSRLEIARSLGAEATFEADQVENVAAWAGEDGLDASVDAVGADTTKAQSLSLLRPGGTAVWIGLHENSSLMNAYDLILPEKRLLGSYACTQAELSQALDLIADAKVDTSWISAYALEQAESGFSRMLDPGPGDVKGVLVMK